MAYIFGTTMKVPSFSAQYFHTYYTSEVQIEAESAHFDISKQKMAFYSLELGRNCQLLKWILAKYEAENVNV